MISEGCVGDLVWSPAAALASASALRFCCAWYLEYVVVRGTTSERNSSWSRRATAFAVGH